MLLTVDYKNVIDVVSGKGGHLRKETPLEAVNRYWAEKTGFTQLPSNRGFFTEADYAFTTFPTSHHDAGFMFVMFIKVIGPDDCDAELVDKIFSARPKIEGAALSEKKAYVDNVSILLIF